MINKKELHILIGCSDARDVGQIHIDAIGETKLAFLEQGIEVEYHVIRAPGSFVTMDVYMDIKRTIENFQNELPINYNSDFVSYFVHIQSHGQLHENSNRNYISHVYEMEIVQGSPMNCGMLAATGLGIELEKLLIQSGLEVKYKNEKIKVNDESSLQKLLKLFYAHEGYLAGDWIKSIDYLRTHPRTQRAKLEYLLQADHDLIRLGVLVTAGIQDYSIHTLIRTDGGFPKVPFWDTLQASIREKVQSQHSYSTSLLSQAENQEPLAGLICMTNPKHSSRALAAKYYLEYMGFNQTVDYMPNTLFNLSGMSFDMPHIPFGPYIIAGFFYSVKYLRLLDFIVMGLDEIQTSRIMAKIKNDPIMNLIVEHFNVNLIPVNVKAVS